MSSGEKDRKDMIQRRAYAKINLGLDVIRRREDGYHEVRMIMQTVDLYDILFFTRREEAGIFVTTDRTELPGDESNLVYRAARLIADTYGIGQGLRIDLQKNIPMAAGMAGGSSDAAAVFHGMNEIFALNMSEEEMCRLGVRIGADVPYCILGGTALAEGIGERLTRLRDAPQCFLLIAKPDIEVSTKSVYDSLQTDRLEHHPDIDGMRAAIESGSLRGMAERMENVLETVTEKRYPIIAQLKKFMKDRGALNALMSGSGPTVFGVFETESAAGEAYEELKSRNVVRQVFLSALI